MSRLFPASFALLVLLSASPAIARDPAYFKEIRVRPLLKTEKDSAGQKLVYPAGKNPEVTAVLVEIPAGAETGWHIHPVPCFAYILEGEIVVELKSGKKKNLRAGEAFSEVVNVIHTGRNPGPGTAKLVLFAVGSRGVPFAIKKCCGR